MVDNEFTRFDPTDAERKALKRIYGAYDDATALRQLREYPLPDDHKRFYTDHTGRFFEDRSEAQLKADEAAFRNDPFAQDFQQILQDEINREIVRKIFPGPLT